MFCTGVGMEAIEGLHFLASLPLAGTGRTKGGEKTQPFNRFHSRLFTQSVMQIRDRPNQYQGRPNEQMTAQASERVLGSYLETRDR